MDSEFSICEEDWRNARQQLARTIDSSAFQGDAPRERMKDELMQTLAQSNAVLSASSDVREAIHSMYALMEEGNTPVKTKRLRR